VVVAAAAAAVVAAVPLAAVAAGKQGWKGQGQEGCQRWCALTVVCWRGNRLVVDEPLEESSEAESSEEESS